MTPKTNLATDIMNRRFGNDTSTRRAIEACKDDLALGARIHRARQAAGMSPEQLAEAAGVPEAVVERVEHGEIGDEPLPLLRRMVDAVGGRLEVRLIDGS